MDEDLIVIVVENDLGNPEVSVITNTNDEDIISQVLMLSNNSTEKDANEIGDSYNNDNISENSEEYLVENNKFVEIKVENESDLDVSDDVSYNMTDLNTMKLEMDTTQIKEELNKMVSDKRSLEETMSSEETELMDESEGLPDILELNMEIPKETRRSAKTFVGNKSYVRELIKEFPELVEDEGLLVEVLANIMREIKAPPLPEKYCVMAGEKFKCIICSKKTNTLPAAGRHYHEKHGPRYLVCYSCGVDFRSRAHLYRHEMRCTAPDKEIVLKARGIFLGRKGQNRPFLDYTRKFQNGSNSHPYTEICKNPHISQEPTTDHLGKYKKRKYKTEYHCNECPAVLNSKTMMESHINKHLGRRPYRCDKCSNAYASMIVLKRHIEMHDNTGYICDICDKVLKRKGSLIVHLETHLPERRFGCPECSKRYAQKHALNIHIHRVHRKLPDPFGCQICPKRFPILSKLRDHMKKHHGLSLMSRSMFEKYLPKLSDEEVKKAKAVMTSYVTDRVPIPLDE